MTKRQSVEALREAGLRITAQRVAVLDALDGRRAPVSAQELHHEFRRRGANAGLATVYRTLSALADAGVLDTFVHDGEQRFRLCRASHHHHLVCRKCGAVEEVTSKAVEDWVSRVSRARRFRVTGHSAEIYGYCASCA
jgi:Fur family transcriptional regulator, ferric uptake regulator